MKNKFITTIVFLSFITLNVYAENISIQSKSITLDKNSEISVFKDSVRVVTSNDTQINSEYAKYNKKSGYIELKDQVVAIDKQNNRIESNFASYNENTKAFTSKGPTKVITSENYILEGNNIFFDNEKNYKIRSKSDDHRFGK